MRILAVRVTFSVGLTKAGNREIPVKYSQKKKVVFITNLGQMPRRTATYLSTNPTMTNRRSSCVSKNARILPGGCCCLKDMCSTDPFRSN